MSLNHVGITVSDLDRSIAFYRDLAGMELAGRYQVGGEWFDTLTDNVGAQLDVAMLRLGEFTLQLVQYLAGGGDTLPLDHHHVGGPHMCIDVDDVEAQRQRAVAYGGLAPTPIVAVMGSAIRSFYVRDPDGVPVEFLQSRSGASINRGG